MTPAGPPRDPYDAPAVRHRWVFVAGIVIWTLLVVSVIVAVVDNLRNNEPFDLTFWINAAIVVLLAANLIRAARLRRNARSAAALDKSRH